MCRQHHWSIRQSADGVLTMQAVPRGSRLIYNTGRALHKCVSLFEEKRGVLPPPDYLITSVGTKVAIVLRGGCNNLHVLPHCAKFTHLRPANRKELLLLLLRGSCRCASRAPAFWCCTGVHLRGRRMGRGCRPCGHAGLCLGS